MPSDVEPRDLPLNLPDEEAILFGTTESGKAVYYANRLNRLLIGFYDLENDEFDNTLTFETAGIADALDQLSNLPADVTFSIIAEAFQQADSNDDNPYIQALLDAGFTAKDVAAVMPISNQKALRIAGEDIEE